MNQGFPTDEILVDFRNGLAVVTLNRPAVLNALSIDMIRELASLLHQWKDRDNIRAVMFAGGGGRAFCSGGDMKSFYNAGMDYRRGHVSVKVPTVFFAEEYSLNKQIFHYPKPTLAFMNGITMGGGYGIAGNCRYRIATDNTVFAMPEVGIGFFPDVGSMYHLSRTQGHFGRFLALTGQSVSGADMVHCGLADFYIHHLKLNELIENLEKQDDVESILKSFHEPLPGKGVFQENRLEIEKIFANLDLKSLFEVLKSLKTAFGTEVASLLASRSPTSLMVTASYLDRAAAMSFDEIMSTDFWLVQHFVNTSDLYEGVRAQLIDKDRAPQWAPSQWDKISPEDVNSYFTPTGYDLKDVQIFDS